MTNRYGDPDSLTVRALDMTVCRMRVNYREEHKLCSKGVYIPYQEDTLWLIKANRDRLLIDPRLASEDNQSQSADNRRTIEFD